MKDKKTNKVYLECREILFSKILIAFGLSASVLIGVGVIVVSWRQNQNPLIFGALALGIVFLIIFIIQEGPFPYIFTRLFMDENELVIKRFNKRYVYRFSDIKEIATLPKRLFLSKSKTIYFVVSKNAGLAFDMKKIKSPSFVGENYFVILRYNLENIKPLLQYYRRNYEFVNMDKDYFLDEEIEFLEKL